MAFDEYCCIHKRKASFGNLNQKKKNAATLSILDCFNDRFSNSRFNSFHTIRFIAEEEKCGVNDCGGAISNCLSNSGARNDNEVSSGKGIR